MHCPVCTSGHSKPFINHESGCLIVSCKDCGHIYLDLIPTPDHVATVYANDYFKGRKDGYPDYLKMESMLVRRGAYYSDIASKFTKPGSMLDVGCGSGFIMKGFSDAGWSVKGVEPNAGMADFGKARYGFDICNSAFEEYDNGSPFDLIAMIQAIAHFYDVRHCLESASRLLNPGGLLLIETWNKDSLAAKIMGTAWHEYCPPSVMNWFTPASLMRLVEQCGFRQLKSRRTLKKIQAGHARTLLSAPSNKSVLIHIVEKALALLPDETELIYPADDLFYIIFKKTG